MNRTLDIIFIVVLLGTTVAQAVIHYLDRRLFTLKKKWDALQLAAWRELAERVSRNEDKAIAQIAARRAQHEDRPS